MKETSLRTILMIYEYTGPYTESTKATYKKAFYFKKKIQAMAYLKEHGYVSEKVYKKKRGSDAVYVNKKKKRIAGIIEAISKG